MSEEMAYQVGMLTRDGIARGLNPEAARAAALRKPGTRTTLAKEANGLWSLHLPDGLLRGVWIRATPLARRARKSAYPLGVASYGGDKVE